MGMYTDLVVATQIIGMGFASGAEMAVLTTPLTICVQVGDCMWISGQPNSHRTIVKRLLSDTSAELKTFIRPSRGYAKHVRRNKSREHQEG